MKLQLAELTLEKKDGNEQTVLQRLKVGRIAVLPTEKVFSANRSRTYDRFYVDTNRHSYIHSGYGLSMQAITSAWQIVTPTASEGGPHF